MSIGIFLLLAAACCLQDGVNAIKGCITAAGVAAGGMESIWHASKSRVCTFSMKRLLYCVWHACVQRLQELLHHMP